MKIRGHNSITNIQRKSSRPEEAFTAGTISELKILKIYKITIQADHRKEQEHLFNQS
jgi:hypothetical protein